MLPISGLIMMALSFVKIPLCVTDSTFTVTNGEDVQSLSPTRTISAAVDPSNSKTMQYLFGGNASDGDIGIFTNDTLYINDVEDRGTQSFVDYQGTIYRVANYLDWRPQAGVNVYLAKRHVKQALI